MHRATLLKSPTITEDFMTRTLAHLSLLGVLASTGCSSDFAGTWLFQWDRSSLMMISGEICNDAEQTTSYQGDEYEWIDIYTTSGGALVLTNGTQEWVGEVSGESFSVEATFGQSDDSSYLQWNEEIEGELDGKDLSGTSDYREIDCTADSCTGPETECRRQTRQRYVGVRMDGTEDAQRTIGTQASQSASTN